MADDWPRSRIARPLRPAEWAAECLRRRSLAALQIGSGMGGRSPVGGDHPFCRCHPFAAAAPDHAELRSFPPHRHRRPGSHPHQLRRCGDGRHRSCSRRPAEPSAHGTP